MKSDQLSEDISMHDQSITRFDIRDKSWSLNNKKNNKMME